MRGKTFLLTFILAIAVTGCAHTWQDPNSSLPAKELTIVQLLTTPNAYDRAGVIVEGKVWDLKFDKLVKTQAPYTSFKLADRDGNYVNVFALGVVPVTEGEVIQVTGVYSREYKDEAATFINQIEAIKIESKGYKSL